MAAMYLFRIYDYLLYFLFIIHSIIIRYFIINNISISIENQIIKLKSINHKYKLCYTLRVPELPTKITILYR